MEKQMTDEEIRRRILARRRSRRNARRRLIALCAAAAIAIAGGIITGRNIGAPEKIKKDPKFRPITSDMPLLNTAMSQIGNKGGEKFWSWYGFDSHVSWCACFVSWCENETGYLDSGIAPKFAMVTDGIDWFRERGQWLEQDARPSPGDLIFFDWENDDYRDHVGIVTGVVGNKVFTVEGNSSDRCRVKRYEIGDTCIEGYGHIEQQ